MTPGQTLEVILPYLQSIAFISLGTFLLSLVLIPWSIGRLPNDYFVQLQRLRPENRPRNTIFILVLRNVIGSILLIAGIIMLFLPGQGILTILIGLLCMAFPGKYRFVLYLISRPSIQTSLDWIRRKMKRPPFQWQK